MAAFFSADFGGGPKFGGSRYPAAARNATQQQATVICTNKQISK